MIGLRSLGASIDGFLGTYVSNVSSQVAVAVAPVAATAFTLWIALYGYAVARQEVSEPFHVFLMNALKLATIAAVALGGGIYQGKIVSAILDLQDSMVAIVTLPSGITSVSGNGLMEVLDQFDDKGTELAFVILGSGLSKLPVGGWLDLVAGIVVFVGTTIVEIVAGGFLLVAKVALAIVLGLGPIFIVCLAFPATAKFFDAWLGKTINYVLLAIVLAAAIGVSVSVCDSYLTHTLNSAKAGTANPLADAFGLLAIEGALLVVVYQAPQIASGLGGGAAVSGGGLGQFIAGAMVRGMGSPSSASTTIVPSGGTIHGFPSASGGRPSASPNSSPLRIPAYKRAARNRYGRK